MSDSVSRHRAAGAQPVRCAVVTVSDTRTIATDSGGDLVVDLIQQSGHELVLREIIPDDPARIRQQLDDWCSRSEVQAVMLTGGTGVSPRDHTYVTVRDRLDSDIPGYGELFRSLSYHEIGTATILSRAIAGVIGRTLVVTMPGSLAAIRVAMERVLLPELGHLVGELHRRQ